MSGFVHLHNHSDYSLLDGACRIKDYVAKAKEFGMKHVGLTDHGNLFGALHFEEACHKEGINPIIGSEVYVAPTSRFAKPTEGPRSYHFVLYAKNEEGYKNLMILTSKGYLEGFYYRPRIDDELLEKYHGGLMASTACLGGEIPSAILSGDMKGAKSRAIYYNELFGEGNFWLEVMNHGMEEEEIVRQGMRRINEETGIPIIATNDVHFIAKDHANAHDILICISTGKKQSDTKRLKTENPEFFFKSEEEMQSLFPDFPDALENTVKLAERCDLHIPRSEPQLPHYEIPSGFSNSIQYLRHLTDKGLKERYTEEFAKGENSAEWQAIKTRAVYELEVLAGMGYEGYFLIVWDFIDWAKRQDIPVGPGRGSGAGSIVAYALGITDIDPLKYNLLFERFLNPERVSMPDFDIDFCFERRGEVIDYVHDKYGKENVAGICTFGTLKTKAVLKDVARVLDIPFDESNAITKLVPDAPQPKSKSKNYKSKSPPPEEEEQKKITVDYALKLEPKLQEYYDRGGVYEKMFKVASILEGMNRHVSTHACGQVIGQSVLTNYVPLIKDQKSGDIITAYTMDIIESCGLVKMDFLGLKTLTLLKNCEELIRQVVPGFNLEEIPEDDEATFKMLGEGQSEAVFQFESSGMQDILRKSKPTCLEDMIALNALYRPGPMDYMDEYIKGRHGRRKITYPHPDIEDVLKPTYGVIIYQEQVMKIAQIIAGFSLGKADILRSAMGKKKLKVMAKLEPEFIQGAEARGYTTKLAKSIFDMLKPFAKYGFNKSHAAAYSVISYRTAYCKARFPAEFWAATLTNEINDSEKLKEYLEITKSDGLEIRPPDVNNSGVHFSVSDGKIFYGLLGIKGIGRAAAEEIERARKQKGNFHDIFDFLYKINNKTVNRKALESCIQAGALDSIESHNRATLLFNLDKLIEAVQKKKKEEELGQALLFDSADDEVSTVIDWEPAEGWSNRKILEVEREHLGVYVSGHPLDSYRELWNKISNLDLRKIENASDGRLYTMLGILKNVRSFLTKKSEKMAVADIEDFHDTIKLTLFSNVFKEYGELLIDDSIVCVKGYVSKRDETFELRVKSISLPEEVKESRIPEIHIELADMELGEEALIDLRTTIQDTPGAGQLFIHVQENGQWAIIRASKQLNLSVDDSILDKIRDNEVVATAWKE